MADRRAIDQFCNQAVLTCVESAANTLTYKKLETGIPIFDKIAWVISRIEYFFAITIGDFNGSGDTLAAGIVTTNVRTSILSTTAFPDPGVVDLVTLSRYDFGAAASGFLWEKPLIKDFAQLPGGGLIVPPSPIWGAIEGSGLGGAQTVLIKMWYTNLALSPDQYWELVEARRTISA